MQAGGRAKMLRGRRANCLLTLLLVKLAVDHQSGPGVSATLVLRGRWSASVDQVATGSGSRGDHLRGLVRVLDDHQRHRTAGGRLPVDTLLDVDGGLIHRLLHAHTHQVR